MHEIQAPQQLLMADNNNNKNDDKSREKIEQKRVNEWKFIENT